MKTHELKIWPEYFRAVADGRKTFEVRRDDRGFAVGDVLKLREWEPVGNRYTGRRVIVEVTYKLAGAPLAPCMCVLGISVLDGAQR